MKTNNLFKKGFASLALASMMMTSGVYAVGSDAMIDVKKFETDGLSKTMVLAGTDGNGTNTTAFIKSIKGLEAVVNVITASKNMMPLFDSDFQASSNSIKNLFPFKDDNRDNVLRSNFGSMSAILAIPKVDSMSLVYAGAQVKGGDMKLFGNNMKPGHNMLNMPLAFIDVKSLGGQTGTLNLKQRINMNNDNMIAFKRTDLTKSSAIHNPVIKHLSLANVGSAETFLLKNTFNIMNEYALSSIIPSSKHISDNLAFSVLNEGGVFTPSLGENNMKNTSLVPNYVLGSNTAGISCAGSVKLNSDFHSNCIGNDLTVISIIFNSIGNSGANLANTLDLGAAV